MFRDQFFAEALDSRHDAQVLESRRVQLMRKRLNVSGDLGTTLSDLFQPTLRRRRSSIAIGLFKFHRQECQPLANIVMEISRNSAALLLLRFYQLTTHFFQGFLGPLLVRYIDG